MSHKIVSSIRFTNKAGEKKHAQKTTYGGVNEIHLAKSIAGRAAKFYASSVIVTVDGVPVLKVCKQKGLTVNIKSESFA